jgi:hypothetical protein
VSGRVHCALAPMGGQNGGKHAMRVRRGLDTASSSDAPFPAPETRHSSDNQPRPSLHQGARGVPCQQPTSNRPNPPHSPHGPQGSILIVAKGNYNCRWT